MIMERDCLLAEKKLRGNLQITDLGIFQQVSDATNIRDFIIMADGPEDKSQD